VDEVRSLGGYFSDGQADPAGGGGVTSFQGGAKLGGGRINEAGIRNGLGQEKCVGAK